MSDGAYIHCDMKWAVCEKNTADECYEDWIICMQDWEHRPIPQDEPEETTKVNPDEEAENCIMEYRYCEYYEKDKVQCDEELDECLANIEG